MDHEARIAFIQAQTVACLCELEAMKVANQERQENGYANAFDEMAFRELPEQYGLTHNQLVEYLRD